MGGKISVDVEADQDSIAEPGEKCVRSQSFEEWEDKGVNYTSFLNEIATNLAIPPPNSERMIKEKVHTVVDGNPDEFTYKVVLDGEKMKSWGLGNGEDIWAVNRKVKIDRAGRKFEEVGWLDPKRPEYMSYKTVAHFLENPLRIECSITRYHEDDTEGGRYPGGTPEGVRCHGEREAAIFRDGVFGPIVTTLVKSKVKCTPDAPSKTGSGEKVMLSNRVDEYTSMDTFAGSMLEVGVEMTLLGTDNEKTKTNVTKKDDGSEAVVTVDIDIKDPEKDPEGPKEMNFVNKFTYDKDTQEYSHEVTLNGKHFKTFNVKIVWPQVECYAIVDGARESGGANAQDFTKYINTVLDACESKGSLFSSVSGYFS